MKTAKRRLLRVLKTNKLPTMNVSKLSLSREQFRHEAPASHSGGSRNRLRNRKSSSPAESTNAARERCVPV